MEILGPRMITERKISGPERLQKEKFQVQKSMKDI
jgi:hypothetical protein